MSSGRSYNSLIYAHIPARDSDDRRGGILLDRMMGVAEASCARLLDLWHYIEASNLLEVVRNRASWNTARPRNA
jgi:hypothetical protein